MSIMTLWCDISAGMRSGSVGVDRDRDPGRAGRIRAGIALSLIAAALCLASTASAVEHEAEPCAAKGIDAERIATARDQGMNMQEAIADVARQHPDASMADLIEAADLLFHRFKNLPPERAAFEFNAACLDEAD